MANAISILTNARIHTQAGTVADSLAVDRTGRLMAVGSESQVLNLRGPHTKIINARGQIVLPGFYDCHMHILDLGLKLSQVDLSFPKVKCIPDILTQLADQLKANPASTVVLGARYDQNRLQEKQHPTRHDLDAVSLDLPVRIEHTSGHAAVVNSRALEMLGISRNSKDPVGGIVHRDADGEPTGLLLETAAWHNMDSIAPEPTSAEAIKALERAGDYLLSLGITSASDACTSLDEIDCYARASWLQKLRLRVNLMVDWAEVMEDAASAPPPKPEHLQPGRVSGHMLHVGQAKLFSDGAITTRTCWLNQPFSDGDNTNTGVPIFPEEELRRLIIAAHRRGWQVACHAIGDRAIEAVLDAYAEAQRQQTRPRPGHRIEHCMLLNDQLIQRLRRQNIWSIGQPEFISSLGDAYITALGTERASRLSPYNTLENCGVAQAFSSDCPVVPGNPIDGLIAAVTRRIASGTTLNLNECISMEAAVYNFTAAPAFACRTEQDRGTLETGKWADFILIQGELFAPIGEWINVPKVASVFVAGQCVYGEAMI